MSGGDCGWNNQEKKPRRFGFGGGAVGHSGCGGAVTATLVSGAGE